MSVHRSLGDQELAAALGDLLAAFAPVEDAPVDRAGAIAPAARVNSDLRLCDPASVAVAADDADAAALLGRAARLRSANAASALIGATAAVLVPAGRRSAVLPGLLRLALPVLLKVHGSAKRQRLAEAGPAIRILGEALAADPGGAAGDRHLADFLARLQGSSEPAGATGAGTAPTSDPSPDATGRGQPVGDGSLPSNPDAESEQGS
jgi:hypothetical protein